MVSPRTLNDNGSTNRAPAENGLPPPPLQSAGNRSPLQTTKRTGTDKGSRIIPQLGNSSVRQGPQWVRLHTRPGSVRSKNGTLVHQERWQLRFINHRLKGNRTVKPDAMNLHANQAMQPPDLGASGSRPHSYTDEGLSLGISRSTAPGIQSWINGIISAPENTGTNPHMHRRINQIGQHQRANLAKRGSRR